MSKKKKNSAGRIIKKFILRSDGRWQRYGVREDGENGINSVAGGSNIVIGELSNESSASIPTITEGEVNTQNYIDEYGKEATFMALQDKLESLGIDSDGRQKPLSVIAKNGMKMDIDDVHYHSYEDSKGNIRDFIVFSIPLDSEINGQKPSVEIKKELQKCFDNGDAGKQVYVPEDLSEIDENYEKYFIDSSGNSGGGLKKNGEIAALYSNSDPNDDSERGTARAIVRTAIDNGGTYLECFETFLPKIYAREGMVKVSSNPFNETYQPTGWNKDGLMDSYNGGKPSVIFMVEKSMVPEGYTPVSFDDPKTEEVNYAKAEAHAQRITGLDVEEPTMEEN